MGIDDAGRGPLIGPMFLAGVLMTKDQEKSLKSAGITDSKLLTHPTRIKLSRVIKEKSISNFVVMSTPQEIDSSIKKGTNLNTLEAQKTAAIINELNIKKENIKVIVDCPSVNIKAWTNTLMGYIDYLDNLEISCEHKADFNHACAGAASILAKVAREEEVEKLNKKYGDFGSGYPSDPKTKDFLRKRGQELSNSGIFRKTWATWKEIYPEKEQMTLKGF